MADARRDAFAEYARLGHEQFVGEWLPGVYPGDGQPYPHGAKAADRLDAMTPEAAAALAHERLQVLGRPQDVQRMQPSWWDPSEMTEVERTWRAFTEPVDLTHREALGYPEPADELRWHLQETAGDIAALVASKNVDYGPHAINRAPGGALNGIHVRLHDKLERAINLTGGAAHGVAVQNESLRDTYTDIAGYALIALALLDGAWPE